MQWDVERRSCLPSLQSETCAVRVVKKDD